MPYIFIILLSLCFGLSLGLLALESRNLLQAAPWAQRWALWRQGQAQRLVRLGVNEDEAGDPWTPIILGLAVGILAALVLGLALLVVVGVGIGVAWPRLREGQLKAQRAQRFSEQLPGLFEALAAALRAGQSLSQALASAAEDLPKPSSELLQATSLRVGLGDEPEHALHLAGQELDASLQADWRMLCTSVAVVRSSGGKLPELLTQLASTVRERQRLQALIRAQSAQAKLSGWVIGCLPPLLLIAMQILDPELVAPLFHTATGIGILLLAAALEGAGLFIIRKMAEVHA